MLDFSWLFIHLYQIPASQALVWHGGKGSSIVRFNLSVHSKRWHVEDRWCVRKIFWGLETSSTDLRQPTRNLAQLRSQAAALQILMDSKLSAWSESYVDLGEPDFTEWKGLGSQYSHAVCLCWWRSWQAIWLLRWGDRVRWLQPAAIVLEAHICRRIRSNIVEFFLFLE